MTKPHAWFVFPSGEDESEKMRALVAAHDGQSLIGLSTPLPGQRDLSLVQVLTFVDPRLGYRHLFSEDACKRFIDLALSLHAGFASGEQTMIAELAKQAQPAEVAFGATRDELFLLAPSRIAGQVQRAIEELLEVPGAVINPWES